ncbi:MAG TPA: hypothetical protein VKP52_11410 [Pseudolabrys sp.]|jgi:hypothetical protein|nr:hypothetical protein [Pseudolabrys sp.]
MAELIQIFSARGDLAHRTLLLCAMSASGLAWFALRELAAASRRFDDFVRELARFNEHFAGLDPAIHEESQQAEELAARNRA